MAPSATSEIVIPEVGSGKQRVEKHVHGAEDKTPLEAISHGPIVQSGGLEISLHFDPDFVAAVSMARCSVRFQTFEPSSIFLSHIIYQRSQEQMIPHILEFFS